MSHSTLKASTQHNKARMTIDGHRTTLREHIRRGISPTDPRIVRRLFDMSTGDYLRCDADKALLEQMKARECALYARADFMHDSEPAGFVYALANPDLWPSIVKLGCSKNPDRRRNTANTFDPNRSWVLLAVAAVRHQLLAEAWLHNQHEAANVGGEFFRMSYDAAHKAVEEAYGRFGLDC